MTNTPHLALKDNGATLRQVNLTSPRDYITGQQHGDVQVVCFSLARLPQMALTANTAAETLVTVSSSDFEKLLEARHAGKSVEVAATLYEKPKNPHSIIDETGPTPPRPTVRAVTVAYNNGN